jgi:Flp pilus assembly protein TadD
VIRGEIALRKGDSTAVESFSRAALVNRGDSMLRSRRSIIKTQAKNFLKFGNYAAAALSYDCLVMIDPNDVESLVAYAKVLSKLGKGDLAEKARERAKELLKNEK